MLSDLPHSEAGALDSYSDDQLAGAAAVGDTEAFSMLVRRMTPRLLRFLKRMVDDPQTAEDLTQETLVSAWKSLPDFGFRSSVLTWMFAIAHRKALGHYRRTRDTPVDDSGLADIETKEPSPVAHAEHSALVDALRAELGRLPSTSRAVWWLKEVEGLTLNEIAQVLHVSDGSVRGHLQRSRRFLSTRLARWRPGGGPESDTVNYEPEGGERR